MVPVTEEIKRDIMVKENSEAISSLQVQKKDYDEITIKLKLRW